MGQKLETIRIVHGDGFLRINKVDFDPEIHQEYTGEIPATVDALPSVIDLNHADISQIKALPGVATVANAKKIINARPLTLDTFKELGIDVDLSSVTFGE